jgi:hypothetical protein
MHWGLLGAECEADEELDELRDPAETRQGYTSPHGRTSVGQFVVTFQVDLGGPVLLAKNISVFTHPKSLLELEPSRPTRGAYRDRLGRIKS